jgi:hypothetical protein
MVGSLQNPQSGNPFKAAFNNLQANQQYATGSLLTSTANACMHIFVHKLIQILDLEP